MVQGQGCQEWRGQGPGGMEFKWLQILLMEEKKKKCKNRNKMKKIIEKKKKSWLQLTMTKAIEQILASF